MVILILLKLAVKKYSCPKLLHVPRMYGNVQNFKIKTIKYNDLFRFFNSVVSKTNKRNVFSSYWPTVMKQLRANAYSNYSI